MGKKGFTVLEVIIVLAVLAIIGGLGYSGLISIRRTVQVQSAYSDFISLVKDIQNQAGNSVAIGVDVSTGKPFLPDVYAIAVANNPPGKTQYQTWTCSYTSPSKTNVSCIPLQTFSLSQYYTYFWTDDLQCPFFGFTRLTKDIVAINPVTGALDTNQTGSGFNNSCNITVVSNDFATAGFSKTIAVDFRNNTLELSSN